MTDARRTRAARRRRYRLDAAAEILLHAEFAVLGALRTAWLNAPPDVDDRRFTVLDDLGYHFLQHGPRRPRRREVLIGQVRSARDEERAVSRRGDPRLQDGAIPSLLIERAIERDLIEAIEPTRLRDGDPRASSARK